MPTNLGWCSKIPWQPMGWNGSKNISLKKGRLRKHEPKAPKREWHLVDNYCCEDNHSNQHILEHVVLVLSVNQRWNQSQYLFLCYWFWGNTLKIFHVLTDCDHPLENFTAWSTHAGVLRREDFYNGTPKLSNWYWVRFTWIIVCWWLSC